MICIDQNYSKSIEYCYQVGITPSVNVRENNGLPVPVIARCMVPCEGKTPCLRLCPVFADRPSYPNISPLNLKACGGCDVISEEVAKTLFGNANGNKKTQTCLIQQMSFYV